MNCSNAEHIMLSKKLNEAYAGIELPDMAEERLLTMIAAHDKRFGRIMRLAACMALVASFAVFAAQSGFVAAALDAVFEPAAPKAPAVKASGYDATASSGGGSAIAVGDAPGENMMSMQDVSPVVSAANDSGAFVWTGAKDSYWTNAANWTVGGAVASRFPGIKESDLDASGDTLQPADRLSDTAVFGTIASESATIDLSGLYHIFKVEVSGATRYTFGADETQCFPLGAGGTLDILADTVAVPSFPGVFAVGVCVWKSNVSTYIYNRTRQILHFNKFGKIVKTSNSSGWATLNVLLYGAGNGTESGFQFDGPVVEMGSWTENLNVLSTGKIVVNTDLSGSFYRFVNQSPGLKIEIAENAVLGAGSGNGSGFTVNASLSVSGKGKIRFPFLHGAPNYNSKGHLIMKNAGAVFEIGVPVEFYEYGKLEPGVSPEFIIRPDSNSDGGTVAFFGENNFNGAIVNNGTAVLRVADAGWFADNGLIFGGGGGIEYTGGAAVFDDAVCVTNGASFTMRNSGGGVLRFASELDITKSDVSLVLDGAAGEIVCACAFTGEKPADITVAGAAGVVLPSDLDTSLLPEIKMACGRLRVAGGANKTVASLTVGSGKNILALDDGTVLSLGSLSRNGGSLDIRPQGDAVVIVESLSGTSPAGITYCGMPVSFDENGVAKGFVSGAVNIAAKGDKVPSSVSVAISASGTGGNNTLSEDTVCISDLLHMDGASSTIALGSGQRLELDRLYLGETSGSLNIGDTPGCGTLGAFSGDKIVCTNDSEKGALTINAKMAEGSTLSVGRGTVTFAGGAERANPLGFQVSKGARLRLAGENAVHLAGFRSGCENLAFDGAKDVRIGEKPLIVGRYIGVKFSSKPSVPELTISDSFVRSDREHAADFANTAEYALVAGYDWGVGVIRIKDGAIVTNRLFVGSIPDSASNVRLDGAVYQSGGIMCALGNVGDRFGSYIGGTANKGGLGVYELSGGKFTSLGQFGVGESTAWGGIFLQTGGEAYFSTNAPHGSANNALTVAMANSSFGKTVFWGGSAKVEGDLRLSCGSGGSASRAYLCVGGTASVDVGSQRILGTPTGINGYSDSSTKWNKQGYVNLNGGVLRAASVVKAVEYFDRYVAVSFDGGTLKTGADRQDVFSGVNEISVFAGGATVDTDGKTGNKTSKPFSSPMSGGVKEVPFAPVYSCLRPQVRIDGDGMGAAAIAEFDEERGLVTGIKVLCPGWGYTRAEAKVFTSIYGLVDSGNVDAVIVCEIGDSVSGGFTKKGDGDFTFNAVNTYGGSTVVEGGVLRLGVTGALPDGSRLVFKGGAIEVAPGVELPRSVEVEVPDADENVPRYTLVDFADETAAAGTGFKLVGELGDKWVLERFGATLRLRLRKGMTIVVK